MTAPQLLARKRVWLTTAVAALAAFGLARLASPEVDSPEPPAGPNVLVLVIDTVRADRCSFNGYGRATTPRLEELARDAVVYRNAYAPAGWTAPVHASLFTGLRPEHHGLVWGNRIYLRDGVETLAERLSASGWSTGAFSGNMLVSPDYGMAQGFGWFQMMLEPPYPRTDETHERALDFMKLARRGRRPFLVFVNDFQPHTPYAPPESFAQRFVSPDAPPADVARERRLDTARSVRYLFDPSAIPPEAMAIRSDLYDAEIASLDDAIGRFLDDAKAAGLLDNTIVVILSDHGEHFGERGHVEHFASLYRPILHVPLIIRAPGRLDGGRTVDDVVRIEDVFPTILDLCGLETPDGIDGETLLTVHPLRPRAARAYHGPQPYENLRPALPDVPLERLDRVTRSVIEESWHLVVSTDGRVELFDVESDPLEATNIAVDHPDVVDRLSAFLPSME